MAFAIDANEIQKILECAICLEDLWEPKGLPCQHAFCKVCMDRIMEFNTDGSAVITCPLCNVKIDIAKDKTTNDLAAPYQLKYILDLYNKENNRTTIPEEKLVCNGLSLCTNTVSAYCTTCCMYFCKQCQNEDISTHVNNEHLYSATDGYIPLKHHKQDNCFKVFCSQHDSFVEFICCHTKFLCTYCKHRSHHGHQPDTIDVNVSKIKDIVKEEKLCIAAVENTLRNRLKTTNEYITEVQRSFAKTLQNRKVRCLLEYMKQLNNEEERLLNAFNSHAEQHTRKYPQVPSVDGFESILQMKSLNVILQKENIINNYTGFSENQEKTSIPSLKLKLTSSCTGACPLGNLESVESEDLGVGSSFVFYQVAEEDVDITRVKQNMNDFLGEGKLVVECGDELNASACGEVLTATPPSYEEQKLNVSQCVELPSYQEQKNQIRGAINAKLNIGDSWYLLDIHWYKKWKEYIQVACFNQAMDIEHPGPIDNHPLYQVRSSKLKEHLLGGSDYKLINEVGWKSAVAWYGFVAGQQPIKRTVVEHGMYTKNLKVEVYLIELKLSLFIDLTRFYVKEFSKSTVVSDVVEDMKAMFGISDMEIRVWNILKTNTYDELVHKMDQTLYDSGICSGQMLVLELKNENDEWLWKYC